MISLSQFVGHLIPALLPIQGLDDFQELLSEIQLGGQLFNAEV
jgi:hypothetical protein